MTGLDGDLHCAGAADHSFPLQSISKVIAYALALEDHGAERVHARVGVEPSGDAFNSLEFDERHHMRSNGMLSVMHTCGMYDFAGAWAYSVGVPAKSGVSGGILAVVPGKMGIGVFSPGLDEYGNSVRGARVCREISERLGLHVFASEAEDSLLGRAEPA